MRMIATIRCRHWLTVASLAFFFTVFALEFHRANDTVYAQQENPEVAERTPEEASRSAAALATLRDHWDSEIITGVMVDEIKKILDTGSAGELDPLITRLELLEQVGKVYAPDFALWWEIRGRNEIGGKLFWRRDLLNEAINLAFGGGNEGKAFQMIGEAAWTGDPVAKMWQAFMGAEMPGGHGEAGLGNIFALVDDVREMAESGDVDAGFILSMLSVRGDGQFVRVSPGDVVRWLEMAADAGNKHAIVLLAEGYGTGRHGFDRDSAKAKRWSEKARGLKQDTGQLRASSANNLKQLGLVCKMFANESRGEKWPPLSSERGQLAMKASAIYPEYLTDPNIYISPAHPDYYDLIDVAESDPLSGLRDHSYWYLGYAITDEEQGLELVKQMRVAFEKGETLNADIDAPALDQEQIFQLREGIERFFITDINNPASSALVQSQLPVMIERPGMHEQGANVLYLDGHVEFIRYPGKFPMTESFIQALESLDDLKG